MPTPWRPSRLTTILLGFLTVWPIAYFIFFMGFMVYAFSQVGSKSTPFAGFWFIFPLHFATILLMFALGAIYVIHAFRTDRIAEDRRVLWVVTLFFGNMIAFPIYWYLYLWRKDPAAVSPVAT
jgi:hypothetical protein